MALVYEQGVGRDAPFDPGKCKASISNRERWPGFHQCKRKPWKDGWCKQHHPETETKREKESQERYARRWANSPAARLAKRNKEYQAVLRQREKLLDNCKTAIGYISNGSYVKASSILERAVKENSVEE